MNMIVTVCAWSLSDHGVCCTTFTSFEVFAYFVQRWNFVYFIYSVLYVCSVVEMLGDTSIWQTAFFKHLVDLDWADYLEVGVKIIAVCIIRL